MNRHSIRFDRTLSNSAQFADLTLSSLQIRNANGGFKIYADSGDVPSFEISKSAGVAFSYPLNASGGSVTLPALLKLQNSTMVDTTTTGFYVPYNNSSLYAGVVRDAADANKSWTVFEAMPLPPGNDPVQVGNLANLKANTVFLSGGMRFVAAPQTGLTLRGQSLGLTVGNVDCVQVGSSALTVATRIRGTATADASSSTDTTACASFDGGLAVAKTVHIGGALFVNGAAITSAVGAQLSVRTLYPTQSGMIELTTADDGLTEVFFESDWAVTLVLPPLAALRGKTIILVKRAPRGSMEVQPKSGEMLDGQSSSSGWPTLQAQYEKIQLIAGDSSWFTL